MVFSSLSLELIPPEDYDNYQDQDLEDYKAQFFEWVKAPRQNTCIDYLEFFDAAAKDSILKDIEKFVEKHSLTDEQHEELETLIRSGMKSSFNDSVKLIKDCQPKHLL